MGKQCQTLFLGGSKITADGGCSHEINRRLLLGRKAMTSQDNVLKSRDITLPTKVCTVKAMISLDSILKSRDIILSTKVRLVKAMVFFRSNVWMWELDYKESWVPKNWCFWTVVLEKTLESPLNCKEIKLAHNKGDQSWIFIGKTDAEAETPVLWPPDEKNWLIGKDPEPGKDWRQEEKGTIEDEMVGCHHQLDRHEFEQAPSVSDGQGSLACCSSCRHRESDMTEQLTLPLPSR